MHQVEKMCRGVWLCRQCLALSVDGAELAALYLEETGETVTAEEAAQGLARGLAEDLGSPIHRIDHFSSEQVELMQGCPCPHHADLAGIPKGTLKVLVGGGIN